MKPGVIKPGLSLFKIGAKSEDKPAEAPKAIVGVAGRKYGLQTVTKKDTNVLNQEDEDEEAAVRRKMQNQVKSREQKFEQERQQALAQDPTVFSYDDVYDGITQVKQAKEAEKQAAKRDRTPRYMQELLKRADERQKENEILWEQKQLKDRLKDDHLYGDKDKFVTSAYKDRLKEREQWKLDLLKKDKADEDKTVVNKGDTLGICVHLLSFGQLSRSDVSTANPKAASTSTSSSGSGSTSSSSASSSSSSRGIGNASGNSEADMAR